MIFRRPESSPLWTNDDCLVKLSESDLWKIGRLAALRNDPKEAAGVHNRKVSPRDGYEIHLLGLMGEFAVATYFGEPMDVSTALHGDGNGPDLYVGPWSTSVKYASHAPPFLKFGNVLEFRQDIAILAGPGPKGSTVQLHGWTNRQRFLERHQSRDFGYGERVYVKPEDLWPMRGLKVLLFDHIAFPQLLTEAL